MIYKTQLFRVKPLGVRNAALLFDTLKAGLYYVKRQCYIAIYTIDTES